jgi:hypothetical protein
MASLMFLRSTTKSDEKIDTTLTLLLADVQDMPLTVPVDLHLKA